MPHKHGKPLSFSQPLASRRVACFPAEGCSPDGGARGGARRSHHSPGPSPPPPSSASPGSDEKNRGAPSWEANPGAFSAAGLLSGLAKPHKLANWRTAFKAGLRPPWQAPQSCLAVLCLGLGVRARKFVHTPQWGHPWKRLTLAHWRQGHLGGRQKQSPGGLGRAERRSGHGRCWKTCKLLGSSV